MGVHDLNFRLVICDACGFGIPGVTHERGQDAVCAGDGVRAVELFDSAGAVLVNVPHPARFALHKLFVYGEREGAFAATSRKDLHQAAALLAYYREYGKWDVGEAWADLVSRGKGWMRRAKQDVEALDRFYPEIIAGQLARNPKVRPAAKNR